VQGTGAQGARPCQRRQRLAQGRRKHEPLRFRPQDSLGSALEYGGHVGDGSAAQLRGVQCGDGVPRWRYDPNYSDKDRTVHVPDGDSGGWGSPTATPPPCPRPSYPTRGLGQKPAPAGPRGQPGRHIHKCGVMGPDPGGRRHDRGGGAGLSSPDLPHGDVFPECEVLVTTPCGR
jgi:hypothetical protein